MYQVQSAYATAYDDIHIVNIHQNPNLKIV